MTHLHREDEMIIKNKTQWRLIEVDLGIVMKEFGLWQVLWGTDIFLGKIPILKTVGLVALVLGML